MAAHLETTGATAVGAQPVASPGVVRRARGRELLVYFALGVLFGFVLVRGELVSWFRIQEMFRLQSFHMFGVLMSAVLVAGVSVALIKRFGVKTLDGEPVVIPSKVLGKGVRYVVGGVIFGLGWALTGACPGALFALVGSGVAGMLLAVVGALAGTWLYGYLRPRLPH
jgi:uncharacterized membrane protein YedE/YeeE